MAAAAILDNFEWPYLRNSSRSTYIARIARSSLRWHSFLVDIDNTRDRMFDFVTCSCSALRLHHVNLIVWWR